MAKKIEESHIARLAQVNLQRAGDEVVMAKDGKDAQETIFLSPSCGSPDTHLSGSRLPLDRDRNRHPDALELRMVVLNRYI